MSKRERFLAKLSAAGVLLLSTTVMNFAWGAETAPASHHSGRASTRHGDASAPGPVTPRSDHGEVGGPIDTRITVLNGPHSRPSAKTHDSKKFKISRPSGNPRGNREVRKHLGNEHVVRNAIGLPVRNGLEIKAAIGEAGKTLNGGQNRVMRPTQTLVPLRAGVVKPIHGPVTASMNRSMINGTGMVRHGSGTMAIGGANRNVAGGINGTGFRPRHL
jgi:hypothetical protein